jgi:prepilin-type N-terminal cleavage/methylation domain-containing protein
MKKYLQTGFTQSLENDIARKRSRKLMSFFSAGFTLIELLIVIAIIGILSSVILSSLSNSRIKANDSKIKQQLRNFRSAAEIYYNNQNPLGYGATSALCTAGMFADNTVANGNPASLLVFSGVNPAPTVYCGSNATQYALKASLVSGGGWCTDSRGVTESITAAQLSAGSAVVCP